MSTTFNARRAAVISLLFTSMPLAASAADTKSCDKVSGTDRVIALQAVQNLMGRYSHLGQMRGETTIGELFALKTEGVAWRTSSGGPTGIEAMNKRFLKPGEAAPALPIGQLHTHSMLTPVIEIAGDGKTARGVWDSYQPGINNASDAGNIAWVKYGVDFIKEDGTWKIWHMQIFPMFSTPWEKPVTQYVKEQKAAAEARAASAPAGAAPAPRALQPGWTAPKNPWRYDGVSVPHGPMIPEPYCSFDPKTSYTAD
jgi:hypothetical protein